MKLVREILGKLREVRRRKRLKTQCFQAFSMVEVTGFEPATFWSRNQNKCSFMSAPDRKRRAFPSLFCLRRTEGDRFGCRIVACFPGMLPGDFLQESFRNTASGIWNCNDIICPSAYIGHPHNKPLLDE